MTRTRLPTLAPVLVAWLALGAGAQAAPRDFASYVNPFTGSQSTAPDFGTGGGAGNTFPGATRPFGMLGWSPDTYPSTENFSGGYSWDDSRMRGFGLKHMSGAGCANYQDVPFLPTTVPVDRAPGKFGSSDLQDRYLASFDHANEDAEPGYYRVALDPPGDPEPLDVELTASRRAGVGRLTFPATRDASVLINAGGSAMANGDAEVKVDPERREVTGSAASGRFCYQRNSYRIFFAARFSRPFGAHGTWKDQTLTPGGTESADHSDNALNYTPIPGGPAQLPGNPSGTAQAGAYVTFDATADRMVEVRVGISFVSAENARRNLDAEVGAASFDSVRSRARAAWNRALGRIAVRGATPASKATFYTALYHSLIHPSTFSDVNGEYMGMDGRVQRAEEERVRYADFSGWDVYRSQVPLVAMLFPRRASDFVSSLLANARESGWLPKWSQANGQTDVMVGDPADPAIAGAWAFGARDFDRGEALRAMVKGATESGKSPNAEYVQRQAVDDYQRLGYVPHERNNNGGQATVVNSENVWGSASTTLEYALADFAIAQLARASCDAGVYGEFMRRSGNWRNLFNEQSGFIQPRFSGGLFPPGYDPAGEDGFVEGSGAQYTWLAPQDYAGLFAAMGGREAARGRLDEHFAELNAGPHSEHTFLGNEPSLLAPYAYVWAGAPHLAQRVVREALLSLYGPGEGGLPGNDDLGTMSAWYVWNALGLYPAVPGTDLLVLGSPLFRKAVVRLRRRKLAIVGRGAGEERPYVRRAFLDGRRHGRAWTTFARVARGARLRVRLGATPNENWGSRPELAPPSFAPDAPLGC